MKISYKWLKSYVPGLPAAGELADIFTFHVCEVESVEKLPNSDTVFDLKILPDRAHDLLCHRGVAFEIAGLLGLEYKNIEYKIPEAKPTDLKIEVKNEKCRRYMGRIIRNIKVGPSPDWLKEHLESIGQRSINNIVDAANLVMFDRGNPIHVFDADRIKNHELKIKNAKQEQKITLLSGEEKQLNEDDFIIADSDGNALAIAGVKGGKYAEVNENTKNIIIEVANFDPVSVRKTAHKIKIHTDAVKRFENDLSPELCEVAINDITALVLEMCSGAQVEAAVDFYPNKQEIKKIQFDTDFINKKLGLSAQAGANISADEIEKILKNYKYEFQKSFEIVVPPLRLDLKIKEDIVEEIGRILGYDKIAPSKPNFLVTKANEVYSKILRVRKKLLADGFSEVMTYTFSDKGEIEVFESASDKKFLRANLTDGLKESYALNKINAPLLGLDEVKIFEIGTIWDPEEKINVAYGDKKGIKEISLDEFSTPPFALPKALGRVGEGCKFKMWSNFPFITRDISVWLLNEEDGEKLFEIIKNNAGLPAQAGDLLIREPRLVDKFSKDNRISFAYRLIFQSMDRTLTDDEVNQIMAKIVAKIGEQKDWQIR